MAAAARPRGDSGDGDGGGGGGGGGGSPGGDGGDRNLETLFPERGWWGLALRMDDLEMVHRAQRVGPGGRGWVTGLAIHRPTGRPVVVKSVRVSNRIRARLLETELRRTQAVPGIVAVLGAAVTNANPLGPSQVDAVHVVYEFAQGGNLRSVLARHATDGRVPPRILAEIGRQLLVSLRLLHFARPDEPHRHVCPENVFFTLDGTVLLDPGPPALYYDTPLSVNEWPPGLTDVARATAAAHAAAAARAAGPGGRQLPAFGVEYRAPEDLRGFRPETRSDLVAGDIWSLGVTLLECALGHHPFVSPPPEDKPVRLFTSGAEISAAFATAGIMEKEGLCSFYGYGPRDVKTYHDHTLAIIRKGLPMNYVIKLLELGWDEPFIRALLRMICKHPAGRPTVWELLSSGAFGVSPLRGGEKDRCATHAAAQAMARARAAPTSYEDSSSIVFSTHTHAGMGGALDLAPDDTRGERPIAPTAPREDPRATTPARGALRRWLRPRGGAPPRGVPSLQSYAAWAVRGGPPLPELPRAITDILDGHGLRLSIHGPHGAREPDPPAPEGRRPAGPDDAPGGPLLLTVRGQDHGWQSPEASLRYSP